MKGAEHVATPCSGSRQTSALALTEVWRLPLQVNAKRSSPTREGIMSFHLAIPFASEAEALRKHLQREQQWSPGQRLLAVVDALAAVEALSRAGRVREAQ